MHLGNPVRVRISPWPAGGTVACPLVTAHMSNVHLSSAMQPVTSVNGYQPLDFKI
jgi:hypothetical protein